MRKSQEVIGLSIIHLQTGKKLGTVCDLLFDERQKLRGIVLEEGGLFKRQKFIPMSDVVSIGKDAVVVDNEQPAPNPQNNKWIGLYTGQKRLKGRTILTDKGYEVGFVENVYFLEEVGTLIGYELSDGIINDIREGRKWLKANKPLVWGKDVLIASPDQIEVKDARL
ncbi:MAG: PRC-barrel domain-containing protein [Thermoactinomyces sp.]